MREKMFEAPHDDEKRSLGFPIEWTRKGISDRIKELESVLEQRKKMLDPNSPANDKIREIIEKDVQKYEAEIQRLKEELEKKK